MVSGLSIRVRVRVQYYWVLYGFQMVIKTYIPDLDRTFQRCIGDCRLPAQVDTSTPLVELFAAMPWSECEEADLYDVIHYIKKSRYTTIPAEWAAVI